MLYVCNLCEIEIESPEQSLLPAKTGGCLHVWEDKKSMDPTSKTLKATSSLSAISEPTMTKPCETTSDGVTASNAEPFIVPPSKLSFGGKTAFRNRPSPLANRLKEQADNFIPHLIVEARAGTGKTTTLVWGILSMFRQRCPGIWERLKSVIGFEPVPSPQQAKIWEAMALSSNAKTIQFTAFNKALRNDQPILTPDGWKQIGDVEIGDLVFGPDGKQYPVIKVNHLGLRPIYEVLFSDGTEVLADEEHLWMTETIKYQPGNSKGWYKRERWSLKTTKQIMDTVEGVHRVPHLSSPVEHPTRELPLDPYLLGALIGDGSFVYNAVSFCSAEDDMTELVRQTIPEECEMISTGDGRLGWRIVAKNRRRTMALGSNPVLNALHGLGLHGKRSGEKFIPEKYLFADVNQRLAMVQGLMDTDGCSNGVMSPFVTTSHLLAYGVQHLVQSLGGVCSVSFKKSSEPQNSDSYWVNVRLPVFMCPFRLPRKINSWKPREREEQTPRKIISVSRTADAEATCITINSPDHLFLTAGCIPTHNSIVREFEGKWGWVQTALREVGVTLNFNTNHSIGFAAVRKAFPRIEVSEYRVMDLISEVLGQDIRELRRNKFEMLKGTERLVGLCKMNLLDGEDADELQKLVSHHDLGIDGFKSEVFGLVPRIIALCKDPSKDRRIDYDDMVWLPVVHRLNMAKNDLLLVDEAQDLNRCQQALAKMAGHRLILVGDPKQAIYGFAGADVESMPRMHQELAGNANIPRCEVLPLTMTRRCGKAIVREANKIVPDIEAFPTNPEGEVLQALYPTFERNGKTEERKFEETYLALVQDGDMVLCRVNAPLVSQCFRFLKRGIKANIQGRDVGQGLITTIQKMGAENLPTLVAKIGDWLELESNKERAKRNPSESRIIALQDRHDCILAFTEGAKEVTDVIKKIESIFTDDRTRAGIRLSSVHKAKGLEAKRVFILQPKGAAIPHPLAKSPWQVGQEYNLLYVAITRAINQLYFVS